MLKPFWKPKCFPNSWSVTLN